LCVVDLGETIPVQNQYLVSSEKRLGVPDRPGRAERFRLDREEHAGPFPFLEKSTNCVGFEAEGEDDLLYAVLIETVDKNIQEWCVAQGRHTLLRFAQASPHARAEAAGQD
jgi:hypothetical protein